MSVPVLDIAVATPPVTTAAGERILAAAHDLFVSRGLHAVGVDLIADSAGTTKATLYQRFGSKQGLIVAYLQLRAQRWQSTLLTALTSAPPENYLATVFDTAQTWATANPRGCAFINAWAELDVSDTAAIDTIGSEKAWMRELFTRIVGDPKLAEAVHLLFEGAHVASTTLGDAAAYRSAAQAARTLVQALPPST